MKRRYFLTTAVPFAALLLAGCGGADIAPTSSLTGGGSTSIFASRSYRGTVALPEGRIGVLALSIAADGVTATGTLDITGGTATFSRQTQNFNFSVGTYSVRGTVDPNTGRFTLAGSIGGQVFSMNGILPTPTNGNNGSYTLTAGGETYSGTLPGAGSVTPTPNPTATPGGTPTPVPTATPVPSGSGIVSFTVLSKSADCNLNESLLGQLPVSQVTYKSGAELSQTAGQTIDAYGLTIAAVKKVGQNQGTLSLSYVLKGTSTIVPTSLQFTPEIDIFSPLTIPAGVGVLTSEINGLSITVRQWRPTGGNLFIESVSGKTIKLRGENVVFTPLTGPTLSSTGTFTANFSMTLDNVGGL